MSSRLGACMGLVLGVALAGSAAGQGPADDPEVPAIVGAWDLVVGEGERTYPSWFEVRVSGRGTLVASFVGKSGSARPVSEVEFGDGAFRFSIPPQWERVVGDIVVEGSVEGDAVQGTIASGPGAATPFSGRRAPLLKRTEEPRWGEPVELFNGQDLSGWKTRSSRSRWSVRDGLLRNDARSGDLLTEALFEDFRLHAEFRYPEDSNSGIYLRGRYEVQIEDNYGLEPDCLYIGAVYGFLTPCMNAARPAGEWQTLDITLLGRAVTVVLNGERILDRQRVPGVTGGALDSDEGAFGPIMIQGDHGPIEFRRLTLTPAVYGAEAGGEA